MTHAVSGVDEVGVLLTEEVDDARLLVEHRRVQQRPPRLVQTCNAQHHTAVTLLPARMRSASDTQAVGLTRANISITYKHITILYSNIWSNTQIYDTQTTG